MGKNLPKYKKKCRGCNKFKFIKPGWNYCLDCYEKTYGKYRGDDRELFMKGNIKKANLVAARSSLSRSSQDL